MLQKRPTPRQRYAFRRVVAAALSAVLLFDQVLFAHEREITVWDARHDAAAAQNRSAAASTPLLARLTGPASHLPTNRINAVLPDLGPLRSLRLPSGLDHGASETISQAAAVAGRWAVVQDIALPTPSRPKSAAVPVVVFVQDVHGQIAAQKNIAAILSGLSAWRPGAVIGIEGAEGAIDAAPYRGPRADANRFAASFFLNAGVIAGPEYAALAGEAALPMVGVETKSLYLDNVAAVRRAWPLREAMAAKVAERRAQADAAAKSAFTPAMLAFAQAGDDRAAGRRTLGDHLAAIAAQPGYVPNEFPEIERFRRALAMEKTLDAGAAESERRDLVQRLCSVLPAADLDRLVAAGVAVKSGAISAADFCAALEAASARAHVSLSNYP
ncbi:MAG: hypothetical protein JO102_06055, partial [Elusimicrobia bacterium]|nr:hypothetical protein [Elusimicrobiota bacterium]